MTPASLPLARLIAETLAESGLPVAGAAPLQATAFVPPRPVPTERPRRLLFDPSRRAGPRWSL